MAIKQVKGVIIPRHDTAENWAKAKNFIPKKGELIIYDADTQGNTKVRFKFGNGYTNVNNLPFASSDITAEDLDRLGYVTLAKVESLIREYILDNPTEGDGTGVSATWVKEYVDKNVGSIVYLNSREHISQTIELHDVYPIQGNDAELKIVSKNRMKYTNDILPTPYNGITISSNRSDNCVKVNGTATAVVTKLSHVSNVTLPIGGKYTISVDNSGLDTAQKKCYIQYTLYDRSVLTDASMFDDDSAVVQTYTRLTTEPITIDTDEMNCGGIKFAVYLKATTNNVFDLAFNIQVEHGATATPITPPVSETDIAGKKINIYGKNLLSEWVPDIPAGTSIKLDGVAVDNFVDSELGMFYWKGTMKRDYFITITSENYTNDIQVPLFAGDDYTIIGNLERVSDGRGIIRNLRVVKGHTEYDEYTPYEMESIECDSRGVCDIAHLKYPYSYIVLNNFDGTNDGYAIYLKYDPALSRDWTEKQLDKISEIIDYLIENGVEADLNNYYTKEETQELINSIELPEVEEVDLSNYYTKSDIDLAKAALEESIASINNTIVVSETEPTVSRETIWLQPIVEDTGAVDYIVEQGFMDDDSGYYEKWNSGLLKYFVKATGTIDGPSEFTNGISIQIPKDICQTIITHSVSMEAIFPMHYSTGVTSVGVPNHIIQLYVGTQHDEDFSYTVHLSLTGLWK